jgi:hypothetical protein
MNRKLTIILCLAILALIVGASNAVAQDTAPFEPAGPVGSAFTYQGRLTDGGSPADGVYDLRFILYDAGVGGAQVGSTLSIDDLQVYHGYFTVALDFGANAFDGQGRWLEVGVRPGSSSGEYTVVLPRQALSSAPYAVFSQAAPWTGLTDVPEGFADGVDNDWSAHDHLGETWQGEDNPLVITGTFGGPDYAPLVLGNTHANGSGVHVEWAGVAGVHVIEAGIAGVWVSQADQYGVGVYRAGNPSTLSMSTFPTGFEMEGSEGYGLYVGRADMDGVYVFSAGDDGVDARSTDASAYGGNFHNSATGGAGLLTRGGSNSAPDLVLGGNDATNDDGRIYSDPALSGSDLLLVSNDAIQLELDNDNDESGNVWVLNGAGTTVFSINESGDMSAIGTKSAAVTTSDYGTRKLYAIESPQNWFEDFGSAQLVDGAVTVAIEAVFAQTVNLNEEYHVFLTPLGDCSLYVSEKTSQGFTVKAMGGGTCSIAFDYRIVAKRLGYENLRLETATDLVQDEEK